MSHLTYSGRYRFYDPQGYAPVIFPKAWVPALTQATPLPHGNFWHRCPTHLHSGKSNCVFWLVLCMFHTTERTATKGAIIGEIKQGNSLRHASLVTTLRRHFEPSLCEMLSHIGGNTCIAVLRIRKISGRYVVTITDRTSGCSSLGSLFVPSRAALEDPQTPQAPRSHE